MGKGGAGRGLYGVSLILGVFALAEFVLVFLPKLQPLRHLLDAIEIYLQKIHPSIKGRVGDGPFLQIVMAVLLGWIAAFLAIETFSRQADGVSIWRNIAHDACGLRSPGFGRWLCTATKWLLTLLAGPALIIWALLARMRSKTQHVTVGFITIEPAEVLNYVKHIVVGAAMLVAVVYLFVGDGKAQASGAWPIFLGSIYEVDLAKS